MMLWFGRQAAIQLRREVESIKENLPPRADRGRAAIERSCTRVANLPLNYKKSGEATLFQDLCCACAVQVQSGLYI